MLSRSQALKVLAAVLIAWLLVNLVLFGMGKLSPAVFWIAIGVFALVAYKGIPMLRKV